MKASEDMKAYLQERIVIDDNGCWVWQLAIVRDGYGHFGYRKKGVKRWQELARATTT